MSIPPYHLSAPAVAIIHQNGVMTLSFTPSAQYSASGLPPADATPPSFVDYDHWHILTTVNAGPINTANFNAPIGYAGGSLTFTETLSSGTITLTMAAFNGSSAQITNFWNTSGAVLPAPGSPRPFPALLVPANVIFSSTSVLLGQSLTVTLSSAYSGADQWQVNWP